MVLVEKCIGNTALCRCQRSDLRIEYVASPFQPRLATMSLRVFNILLHRLLPAGSSAYAAFTTTLGGQAQSVEALYDPVRHRFESGWWLVACCACGGRATGDKENPCTLPLRPQELFTAQRNSTEASLRVLALGGRQLSTRIPYARAFPVVPCLGRSSASCECVTSLNI
jgi:hypothetical protein